MYARFARDKRRERWENYVADSLHYSAQGKYIKTLFSDTLEKKQPDFDPNEIVERVVRDCGLEEEK